MTGTPRGFPWRDLYGFAVSGLGLSPAEAWASTPRELVLAASWRTGGGPDTPARADLEALIARFPDRRQDG